MKCLIAAVSVVSTFKSPPKVQQLENANQKKNKIYVSNSEIDLQQLLFLYSQYENSTK